MKRSEDVMEILEAFDLTQSFRAAAELAGVVHKTVKRYVERRGRGLFDLEVGSRSCFTTRKSEVHPVMNGPRGVRQESVSGRVTAENAEKC